jgi:Glycosyl transferases group 1
VDARPRKSTRVEGDADCDFARISARRYRHKLLSVLFAVLAGAGSYLLRQTPRYEATSLVLLSNTNVPSIVTNTPNPNASVQPDRVSATQAQLARVPLVAREALRIARVRDRAVAAAHRIDRLVESVDRHPLLRRRRSQGGGREAARHRLRPRDVDHAPHSPVFLLAALDRLVERRPELRDRIRLHLVGPLTIREEDALDQARCRDLVEAHGYLPHEESLALVRSADALFLPLHRLPRGGRATILPAKLYEYLASGRPILAAVPDGDARDLLGSVDWTVLCAPDDVDGMAQGLLSLIEQMPARRGKQADRRMLLPRLERPYLAAELAGTFERVLASR